MRHLSYELNTYPNGKLVYVDVNNLVVGMQVQTQGFFKFNIPLSFQVDWIGSFVESLSEQVEVVIRRSS